MRARARLIGLDHMRREIGRARREQDVTIGELAEAAGYANGGHLARWLGGEDVGMPYDRLQLVLGRLGLELTVAHKTTEQ